MFFTNKYSNALNLGNTWGSVLECNRIWVDVNRSVESWASVVKEATLTICPLCNPFSWSSALLHCWDTFFFASWLRIKPHTDTSICQTETMVTTRIWGKLQKGTLSLSFGPKYQKWVITVLSCGASKSYVYLPWVHHIQEQRMDVLLTSLLIKYQSLSKLET